MSRILISATRKSSGKTTFSLGLCGALVNRGLQVQPFKKGPDFIDPMWLSRVSQRSCINLDFNTMSPDELFSTFARYQQPADISVVEGNKGLFDGLDLHGSDSNAALAKLLNLPVILVIDGEGMTRGIAPLLNGYRDFDETVRIAGVVLNNLGGRRHESKLRNVIDYYTDMEVLGAVQRDSNLAIVERHLGLTTDREASGLEGLTSHITSAVEGQVDIDRIIELSGLVPPLDDCNLSSELNTSGHLRIGVARDNAFCFYYADDLETMERSGVQIEFFDALNDQALPDVDALFIGGGFPETHCDELENNVAMRAAIREFVESGKPVYAECGGLMYLTREISWQDRRHEMVGVIPADTKMHGHPVGRGYVALESTEDHPWNGDKSVRQGGRIQAHEFHYSSLCNVDDEVKYAYRVKRGHGIDGQYDGLVYKNVFASYAHMRHTESNPWISRFISSIQQSKEKTHDYH